MKEFLSEHVGWMYWTWASATVLVVLVASIAGIAIWEKVSPGTARRGFLPMVTQRGDRFFVCVMATIGIHFLWLGLIGTQMILAATLISAVVFGVIFRWG